MVYVYVILAIIVIFFVIRSFSNPEERFAKGIARAQLVSILVVADKYPNMPLEERYRMAIGTRPGYGEKELDEVFALSKKLPGYTNDLADIIAALIIYEYHVRVGRGPSNVDIEDVAIRTAIKMFPKA